MEVILTQPVATQSFGVYANSGSLMMRRKETDGNAMDKEESD